VNVASIEGIEARYFEPNIKNKHATQQHVAKIILKIPS